MIRIENTGSPFRGWVRTTVELDVAADPGGDQTVPIGQPPRAGRWDDGTMYVLGDRTGDGVTAVDVWVDMDEGEQRTYDLDDATAIDWKPQPLPSDIREYLGGDIKVAGEFVSLVSASYSGAAYEMHVRCRVGRMANCDVWLRHYPTEPWIHGEFVVTASNPDVKDVLADIGPLHVQVGKTLVFPIARGFKDPMVDATTFADGQARSVPFKCVLWWMSKDDEDQERVQAVLDYTVHVCGVETLYEGGNPHDDNELPEVDVAIGQELERFHSWKGPKYGVWPYSKVTGKQWDQLFVRAEAIYDRPAWVLPTYLSALKQSARPCHHLEARGSLLDIDGHPNLVMWDARPHWHTGVSPDRLGKERNLNQWDVPEQWYGPDREHWLIGTLVTAARMTGSPALQWQLEAQARVFLFQETVDPRLSTSGPDAARSVGYACIVGVELYRNLRNRVVAGRVLERLRQRIERVYVPQLGDKPGNVWDARNDPRLLKDLDKNRPQVYTQAWMPWQQALGSYGLYMAASYLNMPEAKQMAVDAARAVLRHAYRKVDDRWVEWNTVGYVDGNPLPDEEMAEGLGAHRTGNFANAWYPCAIAVLLRAGTDGPDNIAATEIWRQMMDDTRFGRRSWFPPEIAPLREATE